MDVAICIQYFLYTDYVFCLRMGMIRTETYKTVKHILLFSLLYRAFWNLKLVIHQQMHYLLHFNFT
jgi:hypothetical protein